MKNLGNMEEPENKIDAFDPGRLTCARVQKQLANVVSNDYFIQELCKHVTTQDICSLNENDLISCLRPLLFKTTRTLEDSWQSNQRNSGHSLPEELVEEIISRVPFPSLFKARMLSKAWSLKFPFQTVKCLQPYFGDKISSVSSRWTTYCPFILTQNNILCFDRHSFRWKAMMSLSHLPVRVHNLRDICNLGYDNCFYCHVITAGSLVCFVHVCVKGHDHNHKVYASNVITKTWRRLPDPPRMERGSRPAGMRLLPVGSGCYKLVLVYRSVTHIYNSCMQTWAVRRYVTDSFKCRTFSNIAYLDKKLYGLFIDSDDVMYCLRIKVEDEDSGDKVEHDAWLRLPPQSLISATFKYSATFVYKDKLIMVIAWFPRQPSLRNQVGFPGFPKVNCLENKIGIFQLDRTTWELTEVCRGPPLHLLREVLMLQDDDCPHYLELTFQGDFIYFGLIWPRNCIWDTNILVITYNFQSHGWSSIPNLPSCYRTQSKEWVSFGFEPGSNPFASL